MNVQKSGYLSIEQLTDRYLAPAQRTGAERTTDGLTFEEVLRQRALQGAEVGALKFSKHAAVRMADRNIELSTEQLARLNDGAKKAGQKGIRDSLVIVDELAFIVNVPNQTVVTAMDSTETSENVFTNINGAVII
nr:TIGR02530 family flagellar biosynthesis protein [uncultured Acetatifactor sp.]